MLPTFKLPYLWKTRIRRNLPVRSILFSFFYRFFNEWNTTWPDKIHELLRISIVIIALTCQQHLFYIVILCERIQNYKWILSYDRFSWLLGIAIRKNINSLLSTFICYNYFKNWNQYCCRSFWAWYKKTLIAYQINHAHAETLMDFQWLNYLFFYRCRREGISSQCLL